MFRCDFRVTVCGLIITACNTENFYQRTMSLIVFLIAMLTTRPGLSLPDVKLDFPASEFQSTPPQTCLPCTCNQTVANCTRRGLKEFPSNIPRTIQVLLMDHNKIVNLFNDTFKNIPHIKVLDMSNCKLCNIEAGAFLPLKNIEELDISENRYLNFNNFMNITYGLINSSIRILKANAIVRMWSFCNKLLKQHTQYLKKTALQKLHFDYNRLEVFESGALSNLPDTLWYISVRYNKFSNGPHMRELTTLKNVTHLYLGNEESSPFPYIPTLKQIGSESCVSCETNCNSVFQSGLEKHLEYDSDLLPPLTSEYSLRPPILYLPPNLQLLQIVCEALHFDMPKIQFSKNNVTRLDLNCNLLSSWIGPVEGFEKLETLDLSNNFAKHISTFFFSSFPRLKVLNVSSNFIGSMMYSGNESLILDNLTTLEVLDLSINDIHQLPVDIFRDLVSLTTLNLSQNTLYLDLPLRVANMKNLQLLNLTDNQIRWFSKQLMSDLDTLAESNNLTIVMLDNSISCNCHNLHFLNWMRSSKVNFLHVYNYTCAFDNQTFSQMGTFEDTVTMLERECTNHVGLVVVSLFGVVLALSIIGVAMTYSYRWTLRYWYYAARLRYKKQSPLDDDSDPFTFDAFVSHADEDEPFVLNEMRNRVETHGGIRLNIHHRDFLPGKHIISNILSAIQHSRKTVVVLSRYFLESRWCQYELQLANSESIETGRDILIIIMYEDISTREIPKEVLCHLKTESYITYPHNGNEDQIEQFWTRFVDAVNSN